MSPAEQLLAVQLEQAGIPFEREYRYSRPRRHKADFRIGDLLIEVDGATWVLGRHNRPSSIPAEFEKGALAAIAGFRVIHCTTEQVNDGTCYSWIRDAIEEKAA